MKELARRFMKTDFVKNALKEPLVLEVVQEWTIDSLRRSLKPDGKPRFDEFIKKLQNGEQIALSSYIDMFLGFDFKSQVDAESLEKLEGHPILILANHTNKGAMRGQWEHAAISYYVKQNTDKEIRMLHGFDSTA